MEPKYYIKLGITRNAPTILILLDDAGSISGNPVLFLLSKIIQRIIGKSVDEYERTIKIYKKSSILKKELLYEEKIPENIVEGKEFQIIEMLKKASKENSMHRILKTLMNGEKKIFVDYFD